MSCPFLRETRVRSCRGAGVRKLIVESDAPPAGERCSSNGFRDCKVFQEAGGALAGAGRCPLLDERHMGYCAASPVPHYVPWSEQAGHCGDSGYQYCELWLSINRPRATGQAAKDPLVDGIAVPRGLWYSPNHLWLDAAAGPHHIGIDGFLARVLKQVDAISFVTTRGVHQPGVVLSAGGVDWALVFPGKLMITGVNSYLRHATARLTDDPYGAGWLFEAWPVPSGKAEGSGLTKGLITGEQAYSWMRSEIERLGGFVHGLDPAVMNDGGRPADDFIDHLSREEKLLLMHEFCSPHAEWGVSI
jgi:glycine cleavage system H lipoate-binding protein